MVNTSEIADLTRLAPPKMSLFGGHAVSRETFTIFAGPCRVESRDQARRVAEAVQARGAQVFRAGAFKPCTHPHCDWGMGDEGLEILADVRSEFGLPIVSEAMDVDQLRRVAQVADVVQIGTRNAQNYSFLHRLREVDRPILYKRGTWMNLRETLAGMEWIVFDDDTGAGNKQVMLCERGTVHFNNHMRWTLDLSIVPSVNEHAEVPIVIDVSHGTGGPGNARYYEALARAAVAVGADGLMVEVHYDPAASVSDPDQALDFDQFEALVSAVRPIVEAVGRRLA